MVNPTGSLKISPKRQDFHVPGGDLYRWRPLQYPKIARASELPTAAVRYFTVISPSTQGAFVRQPPTQVVPVFSQFLQWFSNLLWNSLSPTTMKADFQSELSFFRKWNKIARYVKSLKAIASFEVAKAVIKPERINKILEPFLRAAFHCFGQKRIIWC